MPNQEKESGNVSPAEAAIIFRNLVTYAGLTVMVILRRDLGYRIVNPGWLASTTVVEILISVIVQVFAQPNSTTIVMTPLVLFALVSFGFGMYQRFRRWREFNRGVRQHSFYIGTPFMEFSWLPKFLLRQRRVGRLVEPIVIFVLGIYLIFHLPLLGMWLCVAGAGMRVWEQEAFERERDRNLDMVDGLIVADIQNTVVERFEEPPRMKNPQSESRIPTGVADDIHERIKRRRAKQPPPQKGE